VTVRSTAYLPGQANLTCAVGPVPATIGGAQGAATARNAHAWEIASPGSGSALAEPSKERRRLVSSWPDGSATAAVGGAFATHVPETQRDVAEHCDESWQACGVADGAPEHAVTLHVKAMVTSVLVRGELGIAILRPMVRVHGSYW